MDNQIVSVIVNTVDRPDDLRRCLNAVFNQAYRNFEVVVVNNGKEGETRRLLKQFQREHSNLRVVEDKTKKLSYLFNVGWKNASPDASVFAYCADDTEPDKDWLKSIVDWLEEHPDTSVSGPTLSTTQPPGEMFALYNMMKRHFFLRPILRLYEYFVMEDKTFEPGHWPESGAFTMGAGIPLPHIKEPIEIDLLTSGNMGVTREAMEKVRGFDENFLFNHADGDLFIRLKKAGYKMIFHPEVKVLHHMRFGPTRFPEIMGRDTAFYYLKDVRPKSFRGWIGFFMNLGVFLTYWIFKAIQQRSLRQLKGLSGFIHGATVFFKTNTPERNETLKKLAVFAAFLLLFGQSVRKLYPFKGMLAYGDAWPMPRSANQAWQYFRTAWDIHNPGINMPGVTQISFLLAPISLLLRVFSPEKLSWIVYVIAPLSLCFASAYWFLGKIVSSKYAKFISAFIYSVNPVTLGEILGGSVTTLYAHALLPPAVWYLHKSYQKAGVSREFVLFVLFTTLGYVASDHILIWIAPLMLVYAVRPIFNKDKRAILGNFIKSLAAGACVILLTLPYTFYYVKVALPFLGGGLRPDVLDFLLKNVTDTYNHWGIKQAIRFGGNLYEGLYGTDDLWARAGFIIPLLAFSWPIFCLKRIVNVLKRPRSCSDTRVSGVLAFTLGAIAVIFFIANARTSLIGLLSRFPFLLRFRNPSRPSMFLAFCYLPMIALTLDGLASLKIKARAITLLKNGFILVALVLLGYYSLPFFSGDFTLAKNRGAGFTIPAYFEEIGAYLGTRRVETDNNFRTMWVPWTHEETEMKLRYVDPFTYSVPINYGAYNKNDYLNEMIRTYKMFEKSDPALAKRLAFLGVKYIILNRSSKEEGRVDYQYLYDTPFLRGAYTDYNRLLDGIGGFTEIERKEEYSIYENLEYSAEKVDPELAGFAPEDIGKMQRVKDVMIVIAGIGWVAVLFGLAFPRKLSSWSEER